MVHSQLVNVNVKDISNVREVPILTSCFKTGFVRSEYLKILKRDKN